MTDRQPIGYFTFVLHSHLPYVRRAGRWPHGEEMIHEALAETYLPLLVALDDLRADGLNPRLTIGLTPILLEQIGDPAVLASFEEYLDLETHVVAGGKPVGKVVGDVAGPYGAPARRLIRPVSDAEVGRERTVLRPYYVGQDRVAVYARDSRTGMQVWSAAWGYPGDFLYRE